MASIVELAKDVQRTWEAYEAAQEALRKALGMPDGTPIVAQSVPLPKARKTRVSRTGGTGRKPDPNSKAGKVRAVLHTGPATVDEIADATGAGLKNVREAIARARRKRQILVGTNAKGETTYQWRVGPGSPRFNGHAHT